MSNKKGRYTIDNALGYGCYVIWDNEKKANDNPICFFSLEEFGVFMNDNKQAIKELKKELKKY